MSTKHTDRCLINAKDDEPIFVLRAQDELAPLVVARWIELAKERGTPVDKLTEAGQLADLMLAWQREHGAKVPD